MVHSLARLAHNMTCVLRCSYGFEMVAGGYRAAFFKQPHSTTRLSACSSPCQQEPLLVTDLARDGAMKPRHLTKPLKGRLIFRLPSAPLCFVAPASPNRREYFWPL